MRGWPLFTKLSRKYGTHRTQNRQNTELKERRPHMASFANALVRDWLDARNIASRATGNPDGPIHMVAVRHWFDGTHVFVASCWRSRKTRNLHPKHKVSLMVDARYPAASYGITLPGTTQILTADSSQKGNAEIHRKYLSGAALADARVGSGARRME